MGLAEQRCAPVEAGTAPLTPEEAQAFMSELPEWTLTERTLERDETLYDFLDAIVYVNRLASLAEEQKHHPEIIINYNKVHLILTTHKIGGLSMNDFIMAAHIDKLFYRNKKAK